LRPGTNDVETPHVVAVVARRSNSTLKYLYIVKNGLDDTCCASTCCACAAPGASSMNANRAVADTVRTIVCMEALPRA